MIILEDKKVKDVIGGGAQLINPGGVVSIPNPALNALPGLVQNPNLNTTAGNSNQQPIMFVP